MRVNRRPEGLSVARGFAPVLLRRGVLVGLLTAVCVLVSAVGASAAPPPTTLPLCINPGGNVTSIVPPATTCGPNETLFTVVSAAAFNDLQAQVTALKAKEAADVNTLQTNEAADVASLQGQIDALKARATADELKITALQAAANAAAAAIAALNTSEAQDASDITILKAAQLSDAAKILTLQGAVTTLQNQLAPVITAVNAIKSTINGVIDTINTGIIDPLNTVICGLSLGADCNAIGKLSDLP
jgi:hypothetical protein